MGLSNTTDPPPQAKSDAEVATDAARVALARQRARDLRWLAQERYDRMSSAAPPTPEDLSARPARYWMAEMDPLSRTYIREMAAIGRTEGFSVLVTRPDWDGAAARVLAEPNVEVQTIAGGRTYPFVEDSGQAGQDGSLAIVPTDLDCHEVKTYVREEQARRAAHLRTTLGVELAQPEIAQGAVACFDWELDRVALGVASGRPMRMDLGYLERGNVLVGSAGALYALVGRDSVGVSKAVIEKGFAQLGLSARAGDRQVREAIARDLGVDPGRVIYVEQAGAFHIDMAMVPWTPGVVLLNDARAVADVVAAMHPGHPHLALYTARARRVAQAEDIAQNEMRAAGLRVVRVPGRFLWFENKIANFFNGEGGTGASGRRFFATQGGPEPYVRAFLSALRKAGVAMPTFHFLSQDASKDSLNRFGGLGCRAQSLPRSARWPSGGS